MKVQSRVIGLGVTIALAAATVCGNARAAEMSAAQGYRNRAALPGPRVQAPTPVVIAGARSAGTAGQALAMAEPRCGAGKSWQSASASSATAPKDALRNGLRHSDACVRKSAVDAIGKSGDESWLEDLRTACKDANAEVRASAAVSLATVLDRNRPKGFKDADGRFVQSLIGLLRDGNQQVRRAAAESLRRISGMDLDYNPGYWNAWWEDGLYLRSNG